MRNNSNHKNHSLILNRGHPLAKGCTFFSVLDTKKPFNISKGGFINGEALATSIGSLGNAVTLSGTLSSNVVLTSTPDDFFPDSTNATIAIIRQKTTSTLGTGALWGYDASGGAGTNRVMAHAPYSDGNIYFTFGNTTTGRLTVSGESWGTDVDYMLFVAGQNKGREVWRNGKKIGADTGLTATRSNTTFDFIIGSQSDWGVPNAENVYYFAVFAREWSDSECVDWFWNPYSLLYRNDKTIRVSGAQGAQNGSASTRLTVKASSVSTKISTSQTAPEILIRSSDVSTKIAESTAAPELLIRSSESSEKIAVGENSAEIILRSSSTAEQIAPGIQVGSASGTIVIRASGTADKIANSVGAAEITLRSSTEATKQASAESVAELLLRGSITATQIAPGVQTGSASGRLFTRASDAANKIADGTGGSEIALKSAVTATKQSSANSASVLRLRIAPSGQSPLIQPPDIIAGMQSANMLYNFNNVNKLLGLRHAP